MTVLQRASLASFLDRIDELANRLDRAPERAAEHSSHLPPNERALFVDCYVRVAASSEAVELKTLIAHARTELRVPKENR